MATAIGLDIGSSAVRAVQLRHGRNGSSLEHVGQVQLPTGAVRNGEIVEPDVVVAALRQLWRTFRLKSRKVALGLANQQVVVRRLDLPFMTESELRTSLPLQVDGLIPISVDHAILDFCVLGERVADDGARQVRILLVAAQREMIDELLDVVRRARLQPVAIDLDAFAALRSMAAPDVFTELGAEILVDVGSTVTDLIVHHNGAPHFVRTVLFGGESITHGLMEELGVDYEAAERLKARASAGAALSDQERSAAGLLREETQRLVDEIRSSIDYCAAQRDIPAIERIVLTGGTSRLPHLPGQLAEGLNLDVTTGSPLRELQRGRGAIADAELADAEPFLAVAVGLALGVDS
ncbi:MAG TPA: type IV pilus assembly protein PilM [Euzebyales bacterium]|nr:type IV pilus assembly protein PilM [Euzebyales bacterium]